MRRTILAFQRRRLMAASLLLCCALLLSGCLSASAAGKLSAIDKSSPKPNGPKRDLTMKTMGGRQFWGDVCFFHEWRIQKNVISGHCRLLDGDDYRHASGTLKECREKLDQTKKKHKLPEMHGKSVIVVHGIFRSSKSFRKLQTRLKKEGYSVFTFDYPSTQIEIPEAAKYLNEAIESMDGIEEINFVVHSMGGLVVRAYLSKHQDKRIKRMVMMGVPNLGAHMADRLKKNILFKAIFGPSGPQLSGEVGGLIDKLPTPDFEFAILAGSRGTLDGYNPLVPGDDDGTVSVASARLPGAADFATIICLHSFLMNHADAIDFTTRFLKEGRFRKEGDRHPIPMARKPDRDPIKGRASQKSPEAKTKKRDRR